MGPDVQKYKLITLRCSIRNTNWEIFLPTCTTWCMVKVVYQFSWQLKVNLFQLRNDSKFTLVKGANLWLSGSPEIQNQNILVNNTNSTQVIHHTHHASSVSTASTFIFSIMSESERFVSTGGKKTLSDLISIGFHYSKMTSEQDRSPGNISRTVMFRRLLYTAKQRNLLTA